VTVPKEISSLIERFNLNLEAYRSGQYNETQLRREFIDPFFKALGWDVDNEKGYAEAYKDVIHEDAIKVGGAVKAPDYCFRIGGARKFFLEAKKPSVNLKEDISPAFQLRRYAWSAKLPLSILTDFEEFAVYDCRIKPVLTDKASTARILYLTYKEYFQQWDEIASIFSHEAVLKGSFDKYVESTKIKKGTAEVDSSFLKEIELWREMFARNLALRNPELTQRELNFAVQRIIDRIIFLRICEDRGIEGYGRLMALLNGAQVYERLSKLFYEADDRYNSGLFHFRREKDRKEPPDELTQHLKIDDKVLKEIIKNLYYPDSPYEFSVLPADILGQVYEQFLGKVIRLTEGHRAVVEDKPEVKKAGGVYYTPTYIVDYIVKNTVGKLVEGKTPKQISGVGARHASPLRILDPACGSGSFLIGAYQLLLNYHRDWYVKDGPEKWRKDRSPVLYQAAGGDWRLTTAERRRILLNNIFGVDIDPQAVEVTKLSLLLKVLEGENEQTILRQLKMFQERALPDLGNNIKCGNSLIGPDFYDGKQMNLFDEEERYRVNVFDWEKEFPEIKKGGGFDAVIGNPPWGATFSKSEQDYLRSSYTAGQRGNVDSFTLFIECALNRLKVGGLLGFITPDTFLRKDDHLPLREFLLMNHSILELVETGPVFSKVRDTWCVVSIISKSKPTSNTRTRHRKVSRFVVSAEERLSLFGQEEWHSNTEIRQFHWLNRPNRIIAYLASEKDQSIIGKIETHPTLAQLSGRLRISRGEEGSKFDIESNTKGDFFLIVPENVERYYVDIGIQVSHEFLTRSKIESLYKHPKIWIIRIQKMRWRQRIVCTFDERRNSAGMKTLQVIVSKSDDENDLKYLSGILASKLMNYWCTNYLADDMNQSYLENVPIRLVDFSDSVDKSRHNKMIELAEQMLSLHKQLAAAKTDHDKTLLQRQIDATDQQIDRLVYELYGLSEEEIKIVEKR